MSAQANRVQAMPRRPIRLAWNFPPTTREMEAIHELKQLPARMALYAGGELQPLGGAKALGHVIDAQVVGGRVVVTCEWRGADDPPADWMAIVGFHEEPPRRPGTRYPGIGLKL